MKELLVLVKKHKGEIESLFLPSDVGTKTRGAGHCCSRLRVRRVCLVMC